MTKKWVTLFERYEEFHLQKDVGQIPYNAHKVLGYEVELWRKGKIDKIDKVSNFNLVDIKANIKFFNIYFSILLYIIKHAKEIDVLSLFHFRKYTLIYAFFFKLFNRKSIVLIKCDSSDKIKPFNDTNLLKKAINIFLAKKVDYALVEHKFVYDFFVRNNIKAIYMPNGISSDLKAAFSEFSTKKDTKLATLIFIGRCGDPRKNAELAIKALSELPENLGWRAFFVGGETDEFKLYYSGILKSKPYLAAKIFFKGYITDIRVIAELYGHSHIFLMTSLQEGYPISLVEACWKGCMPILSPKSGGDDLVGNSAGFIFMDETQLVSILYSSISNIQNTINAGIICKNYVMQNNDWEKNLKNLADIINHE